MTERHLSFSNSCQNSIVKEIFSHPECPPTTDSCSHCSKVFLNSSSSPTTNFLKNNLKISFINPRNFAGPLVSPNIITKYSKWPPCVLKVVLCTSAGYILTWLCPASYNFAKECLSFIISFNLMLRN